MEIRTTRVDVGEHVPDPTPEQEALLDAKKRIAELEALVRSVLETKALDDAEAFRPGWHARALKALNK